MSLLNQFSQLSAILFNEYSVLPEAITVNARLREDFGIDGDDVDALLIIISEDFGVDWNGFTFHRYFHEEPHLFSLLFEWYYRRCYGALKTITICHLLSVIASKIWFEPA